ncbi:hypothetical protein PFICI_09851 [Pestalotiopsis fici W106-1]|uniref:CorA-like transporter domain-containing protein n=1 Tax=Pestalotiopsis fici (strain W106-1 / CGMCC3.15140) TaxID=1229662 RepID=W3WVE8_PESFW|nr:uncharacterized protein PFICI_09851 [Pestalotiopsis fici W106-1]ETS77789.1 hypothetical protein PFICI_09851 [Pestalotiopsis fici W106-1]
MATISLPNAFSESYAQFDQYPLNIIRRDAHGTPMLSRIHDRLQERTPYLFIDDHNTNVAIADVLSDGRVDRRKLYSDVEIKKWLGDASYTGSSDISIATKKDPRCRFVFLLLDSVTSPLPVSAKSVARLMTYHQVSPDFFDFLDAYGAPLAINTELRFNAFRTEIYLADPEPGAILPELGRSGRHYQINYSLKSVNRKEWMKESQPGRSLWQIRQTAIHHQLDVGSGAQFWMFADPHGALRDRITDVFPDQPNHGQKLDSLSASFKTSLEIQLHLVRWSTEGWQLYIKHLEETVAQVISRLILSNPDQRTHLRTEELMHAQAYEDTINECIITLESNADNMSSLDTFYTSLVKQEDFPNSERHSCEKEVQKFTSRLHQLVYDAKMQIRRTKLLAKVMADRKLMFVQLLQVQLQARSADRAARLSATMWRQAEETSHEAIAMRVITVITLLYLPPTFVSTLFSTDIVKYQGDNGDLNHDMFSFLALKRFLQVTMPLMVLTFTVAFGWVWYERIRGKERTARLEKEYPDVFGRARD